MRALPDFEIFTCLASVDCSDRCWKVGWITHIMLTIFLGVFVSHHNESHDD